MVRSDLDWSRTRLYKIFHIHVISLTQRTEEKTDTHKSIFAAANLSEALSPSQPS